MDLLRPESVVRRLGARTVPIPNGNLSLSKVTAGSSAGYLGENVAIVTSGMTVGQVKLTVKKLAAFVLSRGPCRRLRAVGVRGGSVPRESTVDETG